MRRRVADPRSGPGQLMKERDTRAVVTAGSVERTLRQLGVREGGVLIVHSSLSALGYVLWYAVLPALGTTRAAVLQLAVPVIATLGGAGLLAEPVSARLLLSSTAILCGIAIVLRSRTRGRP